MAIIFFSTLFIVACGVYAQSQCPNGTVALNTNSCWCYKFFGLSLPFANASSFCQSQNGNLASVDSAFTNMFVANLSRNSERQVYLGGLFVTSGFQWVDGQPFSYYNWALGEPSVGLNGCVILDVYTYTWFSIPCVDQRPFLCEFSAFQCFAANQPIQNGNTFGEKKDPSLKKSMIFNSDSKQEMKHGANYIKEKSTRN